jgi:hypothetical protein
MPYFFIIPAYLALLTGLVAAAIITRFIPRFRPASRYILAGAIGTLAGFLIINLIVFFAGMSPVWLAGKITLPDWLHEVSKYFVAATLLIGPFVGSAVGVLVGFFAGLCFVRRRRRHAV